MSKTKETMVPAVKERAAFTLSASVKAELEERIPKNKRSQFVEQAVATALLAEAQRQALAALEECSSYDNQGRDSVELLRRIRQDRSQQIVRRHSPTKK